MTSRSVNILEKKADLIFSYTEEELIFAAELREKYHAHGQSKQSIEEFRNKYVMTRKACESGLNVPKFEQVNSVFDLVNAGQKIGFPMVLKPIDGMGSVDVHKINNNTELMQVAQKAVIKNYLAEEYITWPLYHVDGLVLDYKLKYLIVSEYFENTLSYQQGESIGSVQISQQSVVYQEIRKYAKKLFQDFDTPKSYIFHLEVFSDGNNLKLCEVALRLGGGRILQEIEAEFGFSPVKELLKNELKMQSQFVGKAELHPQKVRGFILVSPGEGKLTSLPKKLPFTAIYDFYQYAKIGQIYHGAHSSVEAVAAISVEGDTHTEVEKELQEIDQWMKAHARYERSAAD